MRLRRRRHRAAPASPARARPGQGYDGAVMIERSWRRKLGTSLALNSGFGVAVGLLIGLSQGAVDPADLGRSVVAAVFYSNVIGLGAWAGISRVRDRLCRRGPLAQWIAMIGVLLAITAVACVAGVSLFTAVGWYPREAFWPIVLFTVRVSVVIGAIGTASAFAYSRLANRLASAQLAEARARQLAAEAELDALSARIHPHFLFNALNSVLSLIPEDPARAEELLEKLAGLLRFALDVGRGGGLIPLSDELRIVRDYLAIESARLGPRLEAEVAVDPGLDSWLVPPLSVQTLVENSVRHAVAARRGGGRVRVTGGRQDHAPLLALEVWDDGDGFTRSALRAGHGLHNLEGRLAALFEGRARLELSRRLGGMAVTMHVPRPEAARAAGAAGEPALRAEAGDAAEARRGGRGARVTLTAFVVDDEPLAARRLVGLLGRTGRVEVVGHSTDPAEAIALLEDRPVDVLFLDIHMPEIDGFDLIERLSRPPLVVFTTAHDEHALRAFQVLAIDYLLKPVGRGELDRALDKLERLAGGSGRAGGAAAASPAPDLAALVAEIRAARAAPPASLAPRRIASRLGDRVTLLELDRISHFHAADRMTYACSGGRDYVIDETLAALERRLDPDCFVRIHRSALVNLAFVTELRGDGGGLVAVLGDPARSELPVARDRVRPLKDKLGL